MRVDMLPGGREQAFHYVLVDTRDRPGAQTTYVAQVGLGMQGRCGGAGALGWGSEMAIRRAVWLGQSLDMLCASQQARGWHMPRVVLSTVRPSQ